MSGGELQRALPRFAAIAALGLAIVLAIAFIARGSEDPYRVTAAFANASQLVGGEQVVVGGVAVGTVEQIRLGESGEALVTFNVDPEFAPLRRGTVATVRSLSLSGVANRRVQLTLPADEAAGEEIADEGTLTQEETVSEVDIDAVFNTLDDRTVADLKRVIEGFELAYDGVGKRANRGLRYTNPLLSSSRRALAELTSDREALRNLLVDTSAVAGAVAQRSPELAELVADGREAVGALGRPRDQLARSVAELPGFMREANTTFVNLRAALDDVDPLVAASRPAAVELRPFLAALRSATAGAVPTIRDLDAATLRGGQSNDLTDLVASLPPVADAAVGDGEIGGGDTDCDDVDQGDDDYRDGAFDETTCSLRGSLADIAFLRAYTPELLGWINDFGTSGVYDANGGLGRIAGVFNTFGVSGPAGLPDVSLLPQSPDQQVDSLTTEQNSRCPGSLERDPGDGSTPYTEGGTLNCDPRQVPPGP